MVRLAQMKHSIYILAILLLYGCSAERRFQRLVRKHPHLIEAIDTVTQYDTIITPSVRYDTTYYPVLGERDTFRLYTPAGTTYVYLNEEKTQADLEHITKVDTTIYRDRVITKYVDTCDGKMRYYFRVGALCFILIGLLMILYRVGRRV